MKNLKVLKNGKKNMAAKRKNNSIKHPGFEKVAANIAKKQGISKERASAILASGARKASKQAVKANPRLKRVTGVKRGM